jgi:tRNA G18 (ribose-2'-O)-methylase SpoU
MNYIGYKYYDKSKTRRSAEVLKMNPGENKIEFKKRCESLGFEMTDSRNLINPFKFLHDTLIKGALNERRFNFSVLLQNITHDFNKASVTRNCNAFCGKEIIVFNNKIDDFRGACGTEKYENIRYVKTLEELNKIYSEFDVVIGVDNIEGAKPVQNYKFNHDIKTLFVFGEEEIGLCGELIEKCDDILYIPQFGSVRSINVACASSIIFHEYTRDIPEFTYQTNSAEDFQSSASFGSFSM